MNQTAATPSASVTASWAITFGSMFSPPPTFLPLFGQGGLMGAREFRRLTRSEAERLAAAKGLALPVKESFTIAEVYNGSGRLWPSEVGRKIGFG